MSIRTKDRAHSNILTAIDDVMFCDESLGTRVSIEAGGVCPISLRKDDDITCAINKPTQY